MRPALIVIIVGLATPVWGQGAKQQPGTTRVDVNLKSDPGEIPSFACVVSTLQPTCDFDCDEKDRRGRLVREVGTIFRFTSDVGQVPFEEKHVGRMLIIGDQKPAVITRLIDARSVLLGPPSTGEPSLRADNDVNVHPGCACSGVLRRQPSPAPSDDTALVELSDFETADPRFPAVLEALRIPRKNELLRCSDPTVCPTSLSLSRDANTDQFVQCVASKTTLPNDRKRLVAVVQLFGTASAIAELRLENSRLTIGFQEPAFEMWFASIGGSFAPGLASTVIKYNASGTKNDKVYSADVELDRRCRLRSVRLPQIGEKPQSSSPYSSALPFLRASVVDVTEGGQHRFSCEPDEPVNNRLLVQVPIGDEGVLRTLAVRARAHDLGVLGQIDFWSAVASWTSRAPPPDLRASWTRTGFFVRRSCVLPRMFGGEAVDPQDTRIVPSTAESCPLAEIGGVRCNVPQTVRDVCSYSCDAPTGGTIDTPAELRLSYAGMEWTQRLEYAYSTIIAVPPPQSRRLFLTPFISEAADELELVGARGYHQTVPHDSKEPVRWVPMPGLECNDSVRYEYQGRFEHYDRLGYVQNGYLRLEQPHRSWRMTVALYVGPGWSFGLLKDNPAFGVIGGEVIRPLRSDFWPVHGRKHFATRIGVEVHLTKRPYDPLYTSDERQRVWYHRELVTLGFGLQGWGFAGTSVNLWLRALGGRGTAFYAADSRFAMPNDFFWGAEGLGEWRFHRDFSLELRAGFLTGEELYRFSLPTPRGEPRTNIESGQRLFFGGHLKVIL